jgi:hypothetical protein
MYEVWFMDCCGRWSLEEVFDSKEEAETYFDEQWDFLSDEEWMEIREL